MKLIVLDRDGVINQDSDTYIRSVDEWIPIPGSIEAIARLSRSGFKVYIATNQSGIGRGFFSASDVEEMHNKLLTLVCDAGGTISGIFYCPHHPEDRCPCRKPSPGLLDQIASSSGSDLKGVPVVGDSIRDLLAGIARGGIPYLVRTGKGSKAERELSLHQNLHETKVFDDLNAVADYLITNDSI